MNVEARLWQHKNLLTKPERSKDCNRHLYNAVQKYGWDAFETEVIESFNEIDEAMIAERELFWMDHFQTCDRRYGFNLRRDSSTKMIVHEETRARQSVSMRGEGNPNFGNYWTEEMKAAMADDRKRRQDRYGDEWRAKLRATSEAMMSDPAMRHRISRSVSIAKQQKNDFLQYDRDGNFVRRWHSVEEIIAENPGFKWQNIYSVCNDYKPTYMGFIWRKVSRDEENLLLLIAAVAA